jgi:hypothetical protein
MSSISLQTKLEILPTELKQEVSDFIDFLLVKYAKKHKNAISKPGSAKGKIHMSADFDESIDGLEDYTL